MLIVIFSLSPGFGRNSRTLFTIFLPSIYHPDGWYMESRGGAFKGQREKKTWQRKDSGRPEPSIARPRLRTYVQINAMALHQNCAVTVSRAASGSTGCRMRSITPFWHTAVGGGVAELHSAKRLSVL